MPPRVVDSDAGRIPCNRQNERMNSRAKWIGGLAALIAIAIFFVIRLNAKPTPSRGPAPQSPAPLATVPAVAPFLQASSQPKITWNVESITDSLFVGTVKLKTVTFTSTAPLTDISIFVVPELRPYVS